MPTACLTPAASWPGDAHGGALANLAAHVVCSDHVIKLFNLINNKGKYSGFMTSII